VIGLLLLLLQASEPTPPTFTRDVAPILFARCTSCHVTGGAAPFPLVEYEDVRSHARQMVRVTRDRYMPPWLPLPGYGDFAGSRRLTDAEIGVLSAWVEGGVVRGDAADLPPRPPALAGWQLGPPDLIVELPEPFVLPATAVDVFRSFVLPLPVTETRYVRAVDLQPGNPRVVHHAVMQIDRTRSSREMDAKDDGPGFDGMDLGDSQAPDGQLIGWTPGTVPFAGYPGIAWKLEPGTDLVLQMHMRPTGKPEPIRPRVGLYFASKPPTRQLWGFTLYSTKIDIAAGDPAYTIEQSFRLPAGVRVLGVYPHAHYLGKTIEAKAKLPDDSERWMLRIDDWDFSWQDQYRYLEPVALPAGTTLTMRYTYDNSAANPRNPSTPPRRVRLGNQSTDEMGSLSFEVVPDRAEELPRLSEALARARLDENPRNWLAQTNLGAALGLLGRYPEAIEAHRAALAINPDCAAAHYGLGLALQLSGSAEQAIPAYRRSLELRPEQPDALYNLGLVLASAGRLDDAIEVDRRALALTPDSADLSLNLGSALTAAGRPQEAIEILERAVRAHPQTAELHNNLGQALALAGRLDEAVREFERALAIDPKSAGARHNLDLARRKLRQR
jgi:tetratricopeptide (TPR) repeat protein